MVTQIANVVLAPVKIAVRLAGGLLGQGGEHEQEHRQEHRQQPEPREPEQQQEQRRPQRKRGPQLADAQRDTAPKDLDDVAIARKVESVIFRDKKAAKGKIDVNVADGIVWLRGEAKTPDLVKELERRAKGVPEVKDVENLLHLPKTPAPTRSDTPKNQRKTRRSPQRQTQRKVQLGKVTEEKPVPGAEPSPKEVAREGSGRKPAPLDG